MSYLESIDNKELILLANDIYRDYNSVRERMFNKVKQYYNQSINGKYHKEEDIVASLERLKRLKEQYKDIYDLLTARGYQQLASGDWRNTDLIFDRDILHSA